MLPIVEAIKKGQRFKVYSDCNSQSEYILKWTRLDMRYQIING